MANKAYLSINPYLMIYDDNGVPCPGAKVWTYAAGSSTPKATYTDYDSGIPASNPVIADAGGRVDLWLASDGLYKLVITDQYDNAIYTQDNVGIGGTAVNLVVNTVIGATDSLKALADAAALSVVALGYRTIGDGAGGTFRWQAGATGGDDGETLDGNVAYTTGRWKRIIEGDCNAKWWGAYGNGTDEDKSYFDAALTYAASVGKALVLQNGTYALSTSVDFQSVPVIFDKGAAVAWTNFSPDMTAIIQPGDLSQHFSVGTSTSYVPKLPSGSTAKPEWFGATANGTTDDINAINQAVASVSFNQGTVRLDGTYAIASDILPKSNVTIQGVGVVLPATGHACVSLIGDSANQVNNVSIQGLTLNGAGELVTGVSVAGCNNTVSECNITSCLSNGIAVGIYGLAVDNSNVSIHDNIIQTCNADNGICIAYGKDIAVRNNTVKDACINLTQSTGTLDGQFILDGNNITDSTGIIVNLNSTAGMDQLVVSNNNITGASRGIKLTDITTPVTVYGNTIVGVADSTGIIESNVSDASYGTNLFNGVSDWYSVSEPRYCTLGTNLRSQIDGDSTVTGNMVISGSIVNTPLTTLLKSMINGLDQTNVGPITYTVASFKNAWKAGTALSTTGYQMTLSSDMTKDCTTSVGWQPGNGNFAVASACASTSKTDRWFNAFLIGKSSDVNATDIGLDTDKNATNLMADATDYDIYRRIGGVMTYHDTTGLWPILQTGDYFTYEYGSPLGGMFPAMSINYPSGSSGVVDATGVRIPKINGTVSLACTNGGITGSSVVVGDYRGPIACTVSNDGISQHILRVQDGTFNMIANGNGSTGYIGMYVNNWTDLRDKDVL